MKKAFYASMDSNERRMRRLQYKHRKMQLVNSLEDIWDNVQDGECDKLVGC